MIPIIIINAFDTTPNASLNATTAYFQTDAGTNFPNLFVSAEAGTIYFQSTQHLGALTIGTGASVQATATAIGNRSLIYVWQYFIDNGTFDLTNNAMDIGTGNLPAITTLIQNGFAGNSSGGSIISSSAASDTTHLTTLGVILNNVGGTKLYGSGAPLGLFYGADPMPTDVLLKYTYYGDANLDGKVDGSDYSRIDSGYLTHATGWYNGDFNYDNVVNGSDYTLIDNAFNRQGAHLSTSLADPAVGITDQFAEPSSAIPEPTGLAVAAMMSLSLLGRRRGRLAVERRDLQNFHHF